MTESKSLDQQRLEYQNRRFLAMPLAGVIVWSIIGISGLVLADFYTVWVLFIGTGSVVYLGMAISKLTGEAYVMKSSEKNSFDKLFLHTLVMSFLVFSIAIPFFLVDYTSLPLTVGILTGIMWVPFGWVVQHWIGLFHGLTRTVTIVLAWYLFPESRFIIIPFIIVFIYIIGIVVFEKRWKNISGKPKADIKDSVVC